MYKVGDKVVYPHHGAGTVVKKETRTILGQEREYLTIKILHNDMTVNVPTENAERVGLRKVIDEEMVERVLEVLHGNGTKMPKNWNRRFKYNRDKMKTGDIFELAEVVRNLSLRDQEKGLSTGEKQMFVKAKKILASELMYAKGMDEDEAAAWLDEELDSVSDGPDLAAPQRHGRRHPFRVLLRALIAALLAAALFADVCSGDESDGESDGDSATAVPSAFTEIVRAELVRAGLEVEPRTDLKLTAEQGPNRVELDLQAAFDRFEDDPDSRDEIVDEVVADAQERLETGAGELSFEEARDDLMPLLKARFQIRRFGFDAVETESLPVSRRSTGSTRTTASRSCGRRTSSVGGRRSRRSTRSRSTTSSARRTRSSRFSASPRATRSFAGGRRRTATMATV